MNRFVPYGEKNIEYKYNKKINFNTLYSFTNNLNMTVKQNSILNIDRFLNNMLNIYHFLTSGRPAFQLGLFLF